MTNKRVEFKAMEDRHKQHNKTSSEINIDTSIQLKKGHGIWLKNLQSEN